MSTDDHTHDRTCNADAAEVNHWQFVREFYGDETFDALFELNKAYANGDVTGRLYTPRSFFAYAKRIWPSNKRIIDEMMPVLKAKYMKTPRTSPFLDLLCKCVNSAVQYFFRSSS